MHSSTYIKIWIALLALTLVEVGLAVPQLPVLLLILLLLALSVAKSAMIVAWFMHLRNAGKALALILFPILTVLILLLGGFLPDAMRLGMQR